MPEDDAERLPPAGVIDVAAVPMSKNEATAEAAAGVILCPVTPPLL